MKSILALLLVVLVGCAHTAQRVPSSIEEQEARDQVERVIRAVADGKFEMGNDKNSMQMMLIYKPATKSSGMAYVGEVFLPGHNIFCNTNFFMYEATDKEAESCMFQLTCPKSFSEYRKGMACPKP